MPRKPAGTICVYVAVLITAACQPPRPRAEPAGPRQWDIELAETVFRRQINSSGFEYMPLRKTVYLSILGEDAPLELITRFTNSGFQVYRGSEFRPGSGVRHQIDRIEQLDAGHVLVDASWYQNDAAAADHRYQMGKVAGRWKIAQVTEIRKP